MRKVAILMGSAKDRDVMQKAADMCKALGIPYDMRVASAHKSLDKVLDFADTAADDGFGVVICGAGKAAHLAGVVAAATTLPVIGVPLSASLDGMDALLSTVQMPTGIPVATVAVDGATNAALLAAQILALGDGELGKAVTAYRESLAGETYAELERG